MNSSTWLRETGALYLRYMAIGVVAIPFALVYAFAKRAGWDERAFLPLLAFCGFVVALVLWKRLGPWERASSAPYLMPPLPVSFLAAGKQSPTTSMPAYPFARVEDQLRIADIDVQFHQVELLGAKVQLLLKATGDELEGPVSQRREADEALAKLPGASLLNQVVGVFSTTSNQPVRVH